MLIEAMIFSAGLVEASIEAADAVVEASLDFTDEVLFGTSRREQERLERENLRRRNAELERRNRELATRASRAEYVHYSEAAEYRRRINELDRKIAELNRNH